MSTTRTWLGGSNANNVYSAANWSPGGAPQPGDALYLTAGTAAMRGGDLAGDTLQIGDPTSQTSGGPVEIDLSGGARLAATINEAAFTTQSIRFTVAGYATLRLTEQAQYYATTDVSVHIRPGSVLEGTLVGTGHNADISVTGGRGSMFANDGASSISNGVMSIDARVVGVGSFTAGFNAGLTFLGAVGAGQTVNSDGADTITIAQPHEFQGLVNFRGGTADTIQLVGISGADSYGYRNDMLTLFGANRVLDVMRFDAHGNSFAVAESASGVTISDLPPAGATLLPLHGGGAMA